jgi:hypothetical protein
MSKTKSKYKLNKAAKIKQRNDRKLMKPNYLKKLLAAQMGLSIKIIPKKKLNWLLKIKLTQLTLIRDIRKRQHPSQVDKSGLFYR